MGQRQLKKVTRNNPCPICGKPDYCYWREREHDPGYFNLWCNRSWVAKGDILTGVDGKEYISIYERDSGTVFEEVEQRQERSHSFVKGERKEYEPVTLTVLNAVEPLAAERLNEIYNCLTQELPLQHYHAEYLRREGWSMELMRKHHICSFPAERMGNLPPSMRNTISRETLARRVMEKLSLKSLAGVPGAYVNDRGRWTFWGKSGIFFPVYDSDGNIIRLRIRMDFMDLPVKMQEDEQGFFYLDNEERVCVTMGGPAKFINGTKTKVVFSGYIGKYRNFTSYFEDEDARKDGFLVNKLNKGCEALNQLTYAINPDDDLSVWWITEGEKKAYFSNAVLRQPFIGISGVADFGRLKMKIGGRSAIDIMNERGCKVVVIAYDADRYENEQVMRHMEKCAAMLEECGFSVIMADWNQTNGKGLDDLLASGHLPAFYKHTEAKKEG